MMSNKPFWRFARGVFQLPLKWQLINIFLLKTINFIFIINFWLTLHRLGCCFRQHLPMLSFLYTNLNKNRISSSKQHLAWIYFIYPSKAFSNRSLPIKSISCWTPLILSPNSPKACLPLEWNQYVKTKFSKTS